MAPSRASLLLHTHIGKTSKIFLSESRRPRPLIFSKQDCVYAVWSRHVQNAFYYFQFQVESGWAVHAQSVCTVYIVNVVHTSRFFLISPWKVKFSCWVVSNKYPQYLFSWSINRNTSMFWWKNSDSTICILIVIIQLMHSIEVNIRICQPEKGMFWQQCQKWCRLVLDLSLAICYTTILSCLAAVTNVMLTGLWP